MSHAIRKRPAIDGAPGWFQISPSRETRLGRMLNGSHRFDVAVVGAGFTGIALARRLAELRPQASIALIDALQVGQGASGRNAGFVIDVPHNVDGGKANVDHDRQLYALNRFAIDRLRALKDQHGIACDWDDAGKYMAARDERNMGALERFADGLAAAGFAHSFVRGADLSRRLGTDYYRAAVYTPGNVLVNPASLVRGLAAALPPSVTLFESSPVLSCDYGDVHTLRFADGTLRADTLVLTVGSFTESFGQLRNRLVPLFTYASLTAPLSGGQADTAFAGVRPWGATSAHAAGTTVRLTPDRRVFVRNTFHFEPGLRSSDARLREAAANHRRAFEARFPALRDHPFAHSWGGLISMTMNHHSVFDRKRDNLYSVVGCNGVGVAKGTYLGHFMAEYIEGMASPALDFILANSRPGWVPPEPIKRMGVALRLRRELAGAGGEI